jgi:predicted Zn-dependent protease
MISIDIGKAVTATAKSTAAALAKKWNGTVDDVPIKVDGEDGFRVKVTPSKKEVLPIDCVVVFKGERVFMLIGGAKEDSGLGKAIDEVVKSWKWKQ